MLLEGARGVKCVAKYDHGHSAKNKAACCYMRDRGMSPTNRRFAKFRFLVGLPWHGHRRFHVIKKKRTYKCGRSRTQTPQFQIARWRLAECSRGAEEVVAVANHRKIAARGPAMPRSWAIACPSLHIRACKATRLLDVCNCCIFAKRAGSSRSR